MTTAPVRWGILGAGRVANGFATGLRGVPDASLVAVASRDPGHAEQFARRHGATRWSADYDRLADDPEIDVVYVATPNHLHAEHAIACLEHGKAVLCEKPFAVGAADARSVVESARERGLFCMEAMWMRFVPSIGRAVDIVASGGIGDVRMLHADFSHAVEYDPGSRLFDPGQGGGALLDLGIYTVSLAQMLLGPPDDVVGRVTIGESGVDEHASMVLTFAGGAQALLSCSLRSRGPNHAVISGTAGRIVLPGPICAPTRVRVERGRAVPASGEDERGATGIRRLVASQPRLERPARAALSVVRRLSNRRREIRLPHRVNGYEYEAAEVVRCLREGLTESPTMPLDDTVGALAVLDRIRPHH